MKDEAEGDKDRRAFFEYLDEAPKIEDSDDTRQCGDLREYLQYDRDYPDDKRICEELEYLQCRNDFSNLDETAASGGSGNSEELVIRTKLRTRKKGRYFQIIFLSFSFFVFSNEYFFTFIECC